jgi:Caspase domain
MHRGKLSLSGRKPYFFLLALSLLTICGPALADKRVALVVGNSSYKSVTPLDNPKNDARLMADTLRSLGFTLVGGGAQVDLDKAGIDRAVQGFGSLLLGADVALFYYAGHGVQVRGANYLVPVDANPTREADVDFQMLDANLVLRQMEAAGTKLNLVILDACRNNPFGGRGLRGTGGGLAQMQAPEGTLISFATQPGNVAQDGAGGDSPYTKALAQTIRRPGLGLFDAFNEVGLAVMQATGNSQQPWVSTSPIRGSFFFAGPPPATDAPKPAFVPPTPQPLTTAPSLRDQSDSMMETVRAFYSALANADGNRAASLVIPEKRANGPLSASAITKYYSSFSKPLQLVGLVSLGDNRYQADYSYGAGTHTCHGSAVVTIVQRNGGTFVEGIRAPKDSCS